MRELTEEELKLAPEWATHYYAYSGGDILFECEYKNALYSEILGFMWREMLSTGICDRSEPLPKKPFDISEHKFSDSKLNFDGFSDGALVLSAEYEQWVGDLNGYSLEELPINVNKDDAIAIAKHFGLTAEDLK